MSQKSKLLTLLKDGQAHRTDDILEVVYGSSHLGLARIAARIWDLKKDGFTIRSWSDETNPSLTFYQLIQTNANIEVRKERIEQTDPRNTRKEGQGVLEVRQVSLPGLAHLPQRLL